VNDSSLKGFKLFNFKACITGHEMIKPQTSVRLSENLEIFT